MSIESIKNALDSLGIKNDDSYKEYINNLANKKIITLNDINFLHPDKIDNKSFWQYVESNFSNPVCGDTNYLGSFSLNDENFKAKVNYRNYQFFIISGCSFLLQLYWNSIESLLEIGPGYGCLKDYVVKTRPDLPYYACDLLPRFDGVVEVNGLGLPEQLKDKKYDFAVSSNVFQHLSLTNRRMYYKDVFDHLNDGGIFSFTCLYTLATSRNGVYCEETNRNYMIHYGQFTEIQTATEIMEDLKEAGFDLLSYTIGCKNQLLIALHCKK